MNIREALASDFAGIMRLYAQLNPEDPTVADGRDRQAYDQILSSDHLKLYVGVIDEEAIATCYLNLIPNITRNVAPYGVIENVVTDFDHRNRGHGHAILRHALRHAWDHGCYKVMLQTGSRRESTHRFYKSCGFRADDKFAFVARPA